MAYPGHGREGRSPRDRLGSGRAIVIGIGETDARRPDCSRRAAGARPLGASAIEGKVLVELNTVEISEDRCRLNFVIENKFEQALDSMKLDLVVFGADGGIMRRFISEMAPLRPMKTVVRAFSVEAECTQIGAILVNDVAACVPIDPNACLDRLELSSRVKTIRLYKWVMLSELNSCASKSN